MRKHFRVNISLILQQFSFGKIFSSMARILEYYAHSLTTQRFNFFHSHFPSTWGENVKSVKMFNGHRTQNLHYYPWLFKWVRVWVCVSVCVCDSNNMQIINEETIVVDDCRCCNLHALFNTLTHFSYHAAFLEFIFTLQTFQKSKMCWKIERKCRH